MLYSVTRLIISAVLLLLLRIPQKKMQWKVHRHMRLIFLLVFFLVYWLLYAIPFENIFVTFSSPNEAFTYANSGEITQIISGEKTDLVIASKGSSDTFVVIPKDETGWYTSPGIATKKVYQDVQKDWLIQIYQYRRTNNFYVVVSSLNECDLHISDNLNSSFLDLPMDSPALNNQRHIYVASVCNSTQDYCITINEKIYTLPLK